MDLNQFYYNYFAKTIVLDEGYNIVNTIVYAIIAIAIFSLFIIPYLKKYYRELNYKTYISICLFISFGSMIRVMEEPYSNINIFTRSANPLELGFYFITPGIYFLILGIIITTFTISYYIEKKTGFNKDNINIVTAAIIFSSTLIYMIFKMTYLFDFLKYILVIAILSILIYYIFKKYFYKLEINEFIAIISQTIDGLSTYFALNNYEHFSEQHVLSNYIIENLGIIYFPIIKIIFTILIITYLRKSNVDINNKNYILLFIIIFGFATGVRNLFSIALFTG